MKTPRRSPRGILNALLPLFLCLTSISLTAQTPLTLPTPQTVSAPKVTATCGDVTKFTTQHAVGSDGNFVDGTWKADMAYTPPGGFTPGAIEVCGKFEVYYEDVLGGFGVGFDDPTWGATRRVNLCAVLTYIQNTFSFTGVASTNKIRLHVNQSFDNAVGFYAPVGTGFYAQATPNYAATPSSITSGYLQQYVTTASDPAPSTMYHAEIQVNFDKIYFLDPMTLVVTPAGVNYQNDHTVAYSSFSNCSIDLYSVLLHEATHCLGWFSLVHFDIGPTVPFSAAYNNLPPIANLATNTFTDIDTSIKIGTIYPTPSFVNLINFPSTAPVLNTSASAHCNANYWINDKPTPGNYPVFSGQFFSADTAILPSYISHLDDQATIYPNRVHICPGDRQEYVMGPYSLPGRLRREYTKGEIQTLAGVLNYSYIGPSTTIIPNHAPFSHKMATYPFSSMLGPEGAPVDYTLVNDGTPLVIQLYDPSFALDLVDADLDQIKVEAGTLTNYIGCGNGGNNHNQLTLNAARTEITYTPRPDLWEGTVWF